MKDVIAVLMALCFAYSFLSLLRWVADAIQSWASRIAIERRDEVMAEPWEPGYRGPG